MNTVTTVSPGEDKPASLQSMKRLATSVSPPTNSVKRPKFLPDAKKKLLEESNSEEEITEENTDYELSVDSNNEYVKNPGDSFLSSEEILDYFSYFRATEGLVVDAEQLAGTHLKFVPKPKVQSNYAQFVYEKPCKIGVATNAFGLCVSNFNVEEFSPKRTVVSDLNSLSSNHRVSVLLPTIQYWWHEPSKNLMIEYMKRIVNDIKCIGFSTLQKYTKTFNLDLLKEIEKIRKKFNTDTKIVQGKVVPSVFGVKLFTTGHGPAKIKAPLYIYDKQRNKVIMKPWRRLQTPTYMNALAVLSITGFKFTKSGMSLDVILESLVSLPVERKVQQPRYINPKYTVVDEMDSDEENNIDDDSSNSLARSKFENLAF